MRRPAAATLGALLVSASAAGAADVSVFDGRWVEPENLVWCVNKPEETDAVPLVFRLTGASPAIEGHDSTCTITRMTPIEGISGVSLDLSCSGAETLLTEHRVLLLNDRDTVTIYTATDGSGGSTSQRVRCP